MGTDSMETAMENAENAIKVVKDFYNAAVEKEWNRIANRPEFLVARRFMQRYIKPGDKVLDIGGGPGRYSLWLAEMGCDVTLFDLSPENVKFAAAKAKELGLPLQTVCGDARIADELVQQGAFDHVLLMGPLYHLLEECDRVQAVEAALRLLKNGGVLFASFINLLAILIYVMKSAPELVNHPDEGVFARRSILAQKSYAGDAFTQAFFIPQEEVLPFMAQFPLEKLHLIGQEGALSHCEQNITAQPQEIYDEWLDFAEQLAEREDLLNWSEHIMYIGRKLL